ncbi:MAG: translational GTPase TypA [Holosporales bacterium]|jgi:GTP-binding protein|nr:translational GTPase TypA [Holosporales bacterium]
MIQNIRNFAIIAHVDHGKTTLVDALLRQGGIFRTNQAVSERALDSNDLERERGITILAKCTGLTWGECRLNIVDTPGHADFGAEVERVLSMVDGVLVLVDAAEGPMPQTKFVTGKALKLGLRPIVVVNKIDKPEARAQEVVDEVFDLFVALEATEEQLDFPLLYASGRQGWAVRDPKDTPKDLTPLFETICHHIPPPQGDIHAPFSLLVSIIESDPFLGRVLTGRVYSGSISVNSPVQVFNREGQKTEDARLTKLLMFQGLERLPVTTVSCGDIVAIAGLKNATVADTITDNEGHTPIPALPIDPPTLAMTFSVNDSPLAGKEGKKVTSRVIGERLFKEAEGNVAIAVRPLENQEAFEVSGRGELQLGILIETMRREGFELSISRPRVLFKEDPETGARLEPMEEVLIDVDEPFVGQVVEKINTRKGTLLNMAPMGVGRTRLTFLVPTRGLVGYHGEFLTDTRGTGVMSRLFHSHAPYQGPIAGRRTGVLVSNVAGEAVAYGLFFLEDRGALFISPGQSVYEGMIIGEHTRENDLDVNPTKAKQLTNMRAAGKDENILLTPPRPIILEQALSYITDDELVEVTPHSIRLRKRYLDPNERKKAKRISKD